MNKNIYDAIWIVYIFLIIYIPQLIMLFYWIDNGKIKKKTCLFIYMIPFTIYVISLYELIKELLNGLIKKYNTLN